MSKIKWVLLPEVQIWIFKIINKFIIERNKNSEIKLYTTVFCRDTGD